MEVLRNGYLDILSAGRDKTDLVKVLTGMRRTGKSTILRQFSRVLIDSGVEETSIISINFDLVGDDLNNIQLNEMLKPSLESGSIHYVFLDEIQNVDGWEKTVAMLVARGDCDIYIAGSNSKMLSSELATRLSGRYIEIKVLPFSFKEYLEFCPGDREQRFIDYLAYGSLPVIEPSRGKDLCDGQLTDIFNTVLVKDILSRLRTDDVSRIERIARFLYSNVGKVTNIDNIAKELNISNVTVERYVSEMISANLFSHAERYDIVGKRLLKTKGKYYATDLGMRRVSLKGAQTLDISRPIENIVYLELIRRGYTVRVGSYKDTEIDFTAFKIDTVEYYQVTQTMMDDGTKQRELSSLMRLKDNYPKTVLTLDRFGLGSYDGIIIRNLLDWLMD